MQPAAHSHMAISVTGVVPEKSSHCSPLQPTLTWQFQSGGCNSWKVLPLQPIAAHSNMAISVRGVNSWKVLPLQPIAAHSYMAISVRGGFLKRPPIAAHCSPLLHGNFSRGGGVIPGKSSHCSPLQPTLTWQFQSGGCISWKVLPLQPIAANSNMAISVRGVNSWKVHPLQPIAAHSCMAISVRGVFLKSPRIAAHCSPLLHGNFSQGG